MKTVTLEQAITIATEDGAVTILPEEEYSSMQETLILLADKEEEVGKMIKSLIDPAVKEEGREEGLREGQEIGLEIAREEIKAGIHELLSELSDYEQYKDKLAEKLCEVKELPKMKELFMAAARTGSVKDFMERF